MCILTDENCVKQKKNIRNRRIITEKAMTHYFNVYSSSGGGNDSRLRIASG